MRHRLKCRHPPIRGRPARLPLAAPGPYSLTAWRAERRRRLLHSRQTLYHGVSVSDRYRWLEGLNDPDADAWVEAQNAYTKPKLSSLPSRERFRQRMLALWNYERFGASLSGGHSYVVPEEHAGRSFDSTTTALKIKAY
jgi:hypothetical protein